MTADREQTRRDAERTLQNLIDRYAPDGNADAALSSLLAELEQAERKRDEARGALDDKAYPYQDAYSAACDRADEAEARLERVPALVEALKLVVENEYDPALVRLDAADALADYEQQQA